MFVSKIAWQLLDLKSTSANVLFSFNVHKCTHKCDVISFYLDEIIISLRSFTPRTVLSRPTNKLVY